MYASVDATDDEDREQKSCGYYSFHSRKCRSLSTCFIYVFEDTVRIIIILYFGGLHPSYLVMCQWDKTWWCPGDWLTYPVVLLSFTITTFFSLYQFNKWKNNNICYTILLFPFLYLCVLGGLGFVPYSSSKSYALDMFGLEKYSKYSKFSKYKSRQVIKYIFGERKSNKELKFSIMAINYYLLSCSKEIVEIEDNSNYQFIEAFAKGNINGILLDKISWGNIRNFSSNRSNFELYFAICVDIAVMIYRLFETFMMVYVWIINGSDGNKVLLILYLISKSFAVILFIIEFPMGFILFHILLNKQETEKVFKKIAEKDCWYPKFGEIVQVIEDILDDPAIHIKYALIQRDDVVNEIIDIIVQYINPDKLPLDGNLDEILEIVDKHR